MARIGVFVCWCGENIARTVDVVKVAEAMKSIQGVIVSLDYKYMCSDPGQKIIKEAIVNERLTGVVVALCSPLMHEKTFRTAAKEAGLNPFLLEVANIREHCSWVHEDKNEGTKKAIEITRSVVERVKQNHELQNITVPITNRALVIGGGIAGIQAALDIANGGHQVVMVERTPSIGGHMAGLSETFPTLDCSQCILTPRMVEVARHPNIKLYTYSEVESVHGFVGNFKVKIRKKARSVDINVCTGCGICQEKCPQKKIPSEFECGTGFRKAIYIPFPQAVPNKPVIDREHCTYFTKGKCKLCEKVCGPKAIRYDQVDEYVEEDVGAIVVATGYEVITSEKFPEYGAGRFKDVINGLQFERLASASGPTEGRIVRPSDGKEPETIVFIACAGSRDPAKGIPYCSKICCMYTAKHAMLYRHKIHHGKAYVFYMDIRSAGKGYDEFVRRAIEQDGALYVRGRVSRIYEKTVNGQKKLIVKGADTILNKAMEIEADMVVLATAVTPSPGAAQLAQKVGTPYNEYEFFSEAHPKLRPVESNTAGVFLAGSAQSPKDIPESVSDASAAASKVQILFSKKELERDPYVSVVNTDKCFGCFSCEAVCPYRAITREEIKNRKGEVVRMVAQINKGLCQGCGGCISICRAKACDLIGYTDEQIWAQIHSYPADPIDPTEENGHE
ncbi:MAG: CoB--CoM heterodisulfide reductase iron-sulfur subunit A family protein [Oligoflexia bacterium]|nr:CoB--CoM heterodisulfide reductase iron-sulfur subunit A family protein [Oligoflexia bacterium]